MSSEVSVPKDAVEAAVDVSWGGQQLRRDQAVHVLRAAAPPLLAANRNGEVAAELDALIVQLKKLWSDPMGQLSAEEADAARVMKELLLDAVARRAAELREEQEYRRVYEELLSARREIDERARREGLGRAEVNRLKVQAVEAWERRNPRRPTAPFIRARRVVLEDPEG